jgi:hypothetical protein
MDLNESEARNDWAVDDQQQFNRPTDLPFNNMLYVRYVHLKRPSVFIGDESILSSERMLHKDYGRKSSLEKNRWSLTSSGLVQVEFIGDKPPVVK